MTPLAALLATIQPGTGKDRDCDAMLRDVRREAAKLPRVPTPVAQDAGPTPPLRDAGQR